MEGYWIKVERNGMGKEYDKDNNFIFEGEYKERKKWNGIFKDYSYRVLIFEAEILNPKIITSKAYNKKTKNVLEFKNGNGYTREYYSDFDSFKFEREFKNGIRNGKGTEYDCEAKLIFEGEYLNGEKNGKGKELFYDGSAKFEGEFFYGERNGKGKEFFYDGSVKYEGEFLEGKRHGKGKEYDKNK